VPAVSGGGQREQPLQACIECRWSGYIDEVEEAWSGSALSEDLLELWGVCREARLFEDVDHGQWGLVLLSPTASAARTAQERSARPSDLRPDDVVIGAFLGDQELVVVAPSENGQRRVLIALPLDSRDDWFAAGPTLGVFLARYFDAVGEKYWEGRGSPRFRDLDAEASSDG
jgi:hypothetical protein